MIPKMRRTALAIAAKLPVADLLPLLAKPASARYAGWLTEHVKDCNCAKSVLKAHREESRSCSQLEEENTRLREVIAQLAGSIDLHRSHRYAAD